MFTQYSRPSRPEDIEALWTGRHPNPAPKQPSTPSPRKSLKPKRPTFGKRKAA